ncbi:MAG: MBOAT family O-acyltransferase [Synergistaceae bacterium]|nr:MBOAT family O-acyltransferase [Synergistaceae bacterium]
MPKGCQWYVLLVDSLVFYFLNAKTYTFIYLLVSVFTVWLAINFFERNDSQKKKKQMLIFVLIINIGLLAILKYTNLAISTVNFILSKICEYHITPVSWVASLCISFYTLQIVSYLLDAYWGVAKIEKNPLKLLLFTSYFPLMVSGPINEHENLDPQFYAEHRFDYNRVTHGMKRIAWGLLKKLAIAGRLSIMVDALWDNLAFYHGVWVWIATIGYVFQLYADFSGCMDIVIGVSECFGIKLSENFNAPLLSKTIQEFWQRWHITLGLWLKKYIMNPLLKSGFMIRLGDSAKKTFGKKQGKKIPVYFSMLVLWLAMGLWHGNSWKYIIGEGLWFWVILVLGQIFKPVFDRLKKQLRIRDNFAWKTWQTIRTFLIVTVGLLFFRADSLRDAILRLKASVGLNLNFNIIKSAINDAIVPLSKQGLIFFIISLISLFIYDIYLYNGTDLITKISEKHILIRWLLYILMIVLICTSCNLDREPFAYAHF